MLEWIFEPAGMGDSLSSGFGSPPPPGCAEPHMPIDGATLRVAELTGPTPAGSARVYLSARDAVKWMEWLMAADRAHAGPGPQDLAAHMPQQTAFGDA